MFNKHGSDLILTISHFCDVFKAEFDSLLISFQISNYLILD